MATLEQLQQQRDELRRRRSSGVRSSSPDGVVVFASGDEMQKAADALDREIAAASGRQPVTLIRINSSKGL